MASLLPDFEYDIFISYRQKDNKGDRWVSEYVDALRTELDKTFKDDISVYFDINPHDGILETHDVGASLREKLRCLVFMPVISRTYCDPKSFAWVNEFIAFIEQSAHDQAGLKVKLPDGNISSRVLPVIIHDLDPQDVRTFETAIGGSLRGIEFIYREPGVNRPLARTDPEERNMNGTTYRNQINRVANAVREIISGIMSEKTELRYPGVEKAIGQERSPVQENSIIVLPFENISPDPDQEYFSDGLTDEVISDLSHIPDLLVISRGSAMTFKGTKNTAHEIAEKVNVRYVLEGTVRRASDNLKINAQLIDSANDSNVWAEKYSGKVEDVFDIQEKVSQSIASALKIKLSSQDEKKIRERPIENFSAYDLYKRAFSDIFSFNRKKIQNGLKLLQKGLDIAGDNALIYAGMAFAWFQLVNAGIDPEENIRKAEYYVEKAFRINNRLAEAHFVMALINSMTRRPEEAMEHITRAYAEKPEDPGIRLWLAHAYSLIGRAGCGTAILKRSNKIDPLNPMLGSVTGWNLFYSGRYEHALTPLLAVCKVAPESRMNQFWKAYILFYNHRNDEALEFINSNVPEPAKDSWTHLSLMLKYAIKGDKDKINDLLTPEFTRIHRIDPQNSFFLATFYAYLEKKKKSLDWLENSVERGFMNYPYMNDYDPFLSSVRQEERFRKLMRRVKARWESFEVYCNLEKISQPY